MTDLLAADGWIQLIFCFSIFFPVETNLEWFHLARVGSNCYVEFMIMNYCLLCWFIGENSDLLNETGSARTSLIVTIGPSSRHYAETTSTIMFGQRVSSLFII